MKQIKNVEAIEKKASKLVDSASEFADFFKGLKIHNDVDYKQATDDLKTIKSQYKEIKGERDAIVRPIKEGVKHIEGLFRPGLTSLESAEGSIKKAISDYLMKLEQKRTANLKEAKSAAKRGNNKRAMALIQTDVSAPVVESVSTREKWDYTILDESLIPREFLTPDLQAIGAYVRANKERTEIPGVVVTKSASVVVRS